MENKKNAKKAETKTDTRLSHVIERNIRTILRMRVREAHERTVQEKIADAITSFSGRLIFVYLHVIWFGAWFVLNSGIVGIKPFDPFPYGLLTMIVSLEAIFLSTFVLISQNRIRIEDMERAELDMHVGLLTEHELTEALIMLDRIQRKLAIANPEKQELYDLEKETRPEDVLAEINRLQKVIK
jgi:uncharacterized membrane protein